jgi:ABC-2 type transport system ATP-binding protein
VQPAIRVESLTMSYGKHLAVDHIDFEVHSGEVFGFLGPNGAGKTTTQRMLTGVLPPTEGSAWVLDHDMAQDPVAAKEHVGVVPEVANPYMEMSGWENMMFAGELYGVDGRSSRRRAEELLHDFELWERRTDAAKRYSKGMRQRLMLAMALLHEPQVLFLDEPTAGLDVASQRAIRQKVRDLASQGVAVFYTTHNIEEANTLCDRVAIIREGRIVALDSPEQLKAAFTGSQSVEVSFSAAVEPKELGDIPDVTHVEKQGDKLRFYTAAPGLVAMHLVECARERNLEIINLNTLGPSLEEVFVALSHAGPDSEGGARP